MRVERFMDYYDEESGTNLIEHWYEGQDDSVQAQFDFVLKEILGTHDLTDSKQFKPMRRQHLGLWEIVLEVREAGRKRQIRPVGFWDYGERDFILVGACEKRGNFTLPERAFDSALDVLGRFFHEGRGTVHEHLF
jgi:hypothetical protein